MHSNILRQIFTFTFNFIMNFEFPWDNESFTLYDYIMFCCVFFVMCYFVYHFCFAAVRYIERQKD